MNKKKYENQLYAVETLKELVDNSVLKFSDRAAYMYKDDHSGTIQNDDLK